MNMDKESMDAMKARISELIETGKSKGVLTYKEIIEQLGDIELDPDQFNRILDTLSGLNIDVIKDDPVTRRRSPKPRRRKSTSRFRRERRSTIRCACI